VSHLRRISLHVDEPDPGQFHWVLMEEGTDAFTWAELASSDSSYPMWIEAWDRGRAALLAMTQDHTIGPRSEVPTPSFGDPIGISRREA
jgi:hypothetical protein